jgi:hypothetical protein
MITANTKFCKKCSQEKPHSAFSAKRGQCVACRKAYRKIYNKTRRKRTYEKSPRGRLALKEYTSWWSKTPRGKACVSAANKKARPTRRKRDLATKAIIDKLKLTAGCMDCGFNARAVALDFDHRDGEHKQFNISTKRRARYSLMRLEAEIAKCDVVCANCHRIRTENRRLAQEFV